MAKRMSKKIFLVSRCAWTLFNFRAGLMRKLIENGNKVVGGGAAGDGFEPKIEALGVKFNALPVDKKGINPRADVKLFWALYRWYKVQQPDIVHHFTIKPVIYGSIAARMAKIPKIVNTVTGLGYVFIDEKTTWLRRLVVGLYRLSLNCADFTFFQNQDDYDFFLSRGLVKKSGTALLPGSGVDCEHFSPVSGPNPLEKSQPTFLMVSRLLKDKGVYEFVEAARLVKEHYPKSRFQLLGRRDVRNPNVVPESDLKSWDNQGLVSWSGEVSDVRPIIAKSDVVVLPSYREGIPRALLEAAAMAKPIITTDAVGCREVVDDGINGLLVPVKDSSSLARAMERMINNPEMRKRMGKAGRKKVEREFDEKIVIQKILEVYDKDKNPMN
ncbi:MAG TPA: glycosyltransferase family 4 protein [Desulfatiglandales bacterium]|nr:glycosyltransferase family 4 protein [Desulfatiglandales bacterium]